METVLLRRDPVPLDVVNFFYSLRVRQTPGEPGTKL